MFHRLATPTYIGGLPGGYDYLNAPPPLTGSPAPVDPIVSVGPNIGTYFVAFGEDGRAAAVNRAVKALADNTDNIDDFLHANIAILKYQDFPVGPAVLVGTASEPVFVGPTGFADNTPAGLEPYFHVTDQLNNDLVDPVSNNQSVVLAVSAGIGTFYVGSVTLTISPAPTVPYRVWYGTRSSLAEMKKDNLIRSSVWGVQRKQAGFIQFTNDLLSTSALKGASLVGVRDATFNAATVPGGGLGGLGITTVQNALQKINDRFFAGASKVDIDTTAFIDTQALTQVRGGGIGQLFSPVQVQKAMEVVNEQLVRRRAFTAVLTDGTTTIGGDYNGVAIDTPLTAFANGASFFVRSGAYTINNATGASYTDPLQMIAEASGAALLLAAGRTSDLTFTGDTVLKGPLGLVSLSTTGAQYSIVPANEACGLTGERIGIMPGAVFSTLGALGGRFSLEDSYVTGTGLGGATTQAGLELGGDIRVALRRCYINGVNGTTPRALYLHDSANDEYASITVEDCKFRISDTNVNAVELKNILVPTIFRNCLIEITATSGTGYAALIDGCALVEFDNCVFKSENGQVLKHLNSTVHYRDCLYVSGATAPGASARGQMIVVQPGGSGASTMVDCRVFIGDSSVRSSSAASTKAVIELGGLDGTASAFGGMRVDGLFIQHDSIPLAHNYTTVLLHGVASSYTHSSYRNITFNVDGTPVSGVGTLSSAYSAVSAAGTFTSPLFVEIAGSTQRTDCMVENLKIVNVTDPTSSHARRVLYAKRANLKNVTVDGYSVAGGFNYTHPIIIFEECDVVDLYVSRNYPIRCSGVGQVLLTKTSRVRGGEFFGRTSVIPSSTWIGLVDDHCELRDFYGFWSSATAASTVTCVSASGQAHGLIDSQLFIDGSWAARMVDFDGFCDTGRIHGNRLYWERAVAEILRFAGAAGGSVTDNIMSAQGNVPTYSVAGGITDDGNLATSTNAHANPL